MYKISLMNINTKFINSLCNKTIISECNKKCLGS